MPTSIDIMTINDQINAGISTFILTEDTAESIMIPEWAKVTIELNGFKLTGDGINHTIHNKGTVIIKDSSVQKTGTVYCNTAKKACLFNDYGAHASIVRAIFDRGDVSWYCLLNWGEDVTIDYLHVDLTSETANAAVIANGFYSPEKDNPNKVFCQCTIYNAYISTKGDPNAPLKNDEYGIMAILGGTFKARMRAFNNWNKATVRGGVFESETGAPIISGSYPSDGGHCNLEISGGVFKGSDTAILDCSEKPTDPAYVAPEWHVHGGKFEVPLEDKYLSSDYVMEKLPDGSYAIAKDKGWAPVVRGPGGIGFLGLSGVTFQIASIEYKDGGIDVPMKGSFTPEILIGATAEGGVVGYLDGNKVRLYRGKTEVSGTIKNLQLTFLGH